MTQVIVFTVSLFAFTGLAYLLLKADAALSRKKYRR